MRRAREEVVRIATGAQGDSKSIKEYLRQYTRSDQPTPGMGTEDDFLAFVGSGL